MINHLPKFKKISSVALSSTLLTLGIYTSSSLLPSTAVYAQESTITAIPPRLEITLNPGESTTQQLKVRNESDTTQYYSISVEDFIVSDNIGTPIPVTQKVSGRWSLQSWIKAPTIVPVDAGATQYVNVTITAPLNANPGGHYAMLTYQPGADIKPGDLKKTASIIGQRTGTLFYVTIPGEIHQEAVLRRFRTSKFQEFGPVDFESEVANMSDIHVSPKGQITIKNIIGQEVAKLPVEMANVFPDTYRQAVTTWNQKWGYGRYSATIDLAYGTAGGVLTATILFWLFPIRLVLYFLLFVISTLTAIILWNKRSHRHEQELEHEVEELRQELENSHRDPK